MYKYFTVQTIGNIFIITINRPKTLNNLNAPACRELSDIWDSYLANPLLWVAIITGAGEKAFCAGHDLLEDFDATMPDSGWAGLSHRETFDKPLIAAVNGAALGGGWEIALSADIVVANPKAVFGLPEPKVGFAALGGGTRMLPQRIPHHIAMGLLLTGKTISADTALNWGLLNEIANDETVLEVAMRWANDILKCSPAALMATKQSVQQSVLPSGGMGELKTFELILADELHNNPDTHEGLLAYKEKRPPKWASHYT